MRTRTDHLLAAAALLALAGCTGHGDHTRAQMNAAKIKMGAMKAGTEWQMARQAFLAGDLKKALKHVDISLELNENVGKSHVLRGRILMEMGSLEDAAKSFQTAEALDPKDVDAQYYQGILYERYAKKDKAYERYARAADLDPGNPQYALAAGELLIDQGKIDEAHAYLDARRERFEHNAGIRQTLGHIAMMKNEHARAIELFSEARLLAPEDLGIQEDLARAQHGAGKFGDCDATLARLLKAPEAAPRRDLKLMRSHCLAKINRLAESRSILMDLTRDQDAAVDPETWIALGDVALRMNDLVRVRQASQRLIALAPERPEGHLLRALQLRRANDLGGAEQAALKAVAAAPTVDGLQLLGEIQQEMGKSGEARKAFAQARQMDAAVVNGSAITSVPAPSPAPGER